MTDNSRVGGNAVDGLGPTLRFQLMGPLRIWRDGVELDAGTRPQRCLLAVLLARGGNPVTVAEIIDLVWGEKPPTSALNIIHKYIGGIRRLAEPQLPPRSAGSYLRRHGNGYRFATDNANLDLDTFRRLVDKAKTCLRRDDAQQALELYVQGLAQWRGSASENSPESVAATATFASIDAEFFEAATSAAQVAVGLRQPARVLAPLRLAARIDRLNEPIHASLIIALAAAGQQAEALALYTTICEQLAGELGIDPGSELRNALQYILTQAAAPGAVTMTTSVDARKAAPPIRPAQLPPDISVFTGRTSELAALGALVTKMRTEARSSPPVVALNGMGGVGKSALAIRFAHQRASEFHDGQLYLDLRGAAAPHGVQGDRLPSGHGLPRRHDHPDRRVAVVPRMP